MIQLYVKGIAYDINDNPIIILTDDEEERVLPIWIGSVEAHAISMAIEGVSVNRPMTFDLIHWILSQLNVIVEKIVINDLKNNTFYAEIHMITPQGNIVADSRPSDAIALAIKTTAPVYLNEKLRDNMFMIRDLLDDEVQEELEKLFNSEFFKDIKRSLH
ncbi:MAG: bifunctional nuclease family protein [Bacillota bacterium]